MEFSAKQIAEYLNGEIVGDANASVHTFAKIEEGVAGALSFLSNPKYTPYIYETQSSVVLVNRDFVPEHEIKATLIKVDNAYESLAKLLTLYESMKPKKVGIDSLAYVAPTAKVGKDVYLAPFVAVGDGAVIEDGCILHPHATVGANAKIGAGTEIYSNAVIYHDCIVGKNCILHAGCVIGADGFGFAPSPEGYEKIPQIGIVIIEDNVEVGANTCIDRATMGATVIHSGVKLDNLIQIAHNDEIGSHTVMAAQVGVAGSTKIGKWCMLGGQVGVAGHSKIGDFTKSGAQAGIAGSLPKGNITVQGSPAIEAKNFARSSIVYKKLPEMYKQLNDMQKKIEELEKALNNKA
ncbi:MAG: UDP-3-O-(3-hydroxymyristoyl)glucosamine N-acyltransferase [Bacteroidales bacterium]|nr:UDP-3-O-(3-hydroxymyristoyl)glucosamine N-acyltransferase [Bacteroidales bacterium]